MDYAENYRWSTSRRTGAVVLSILKDFASRYKKNTNQNEKISKAIDIGCGDGYVTMEVIKTILPESTRLDGSDISEKMIRFAEKFYAGRGSQFFVWNVEDVPDETLIKSYDYAFSFFCLHNVFNQRQALQNVYDVLKPGGTFLYALILDDPFFAVLKKLALNHKWSPYMQDVNEVYQDPYHAQPHAEEHAAKLMKECGFKNVITKTDLKLVPFESWDKFKGLARYVDRYLKKIPAELQEEYFEEYVNDLKQVDGFLTEKFDDSGKLINIQHRINLLIGYGEKFLTV